MAETAQTGRRIGLEADRPVAAHVDPAQPWRLTSFDAPDEKLLNANSPMPYGLEDVRGYDSIIPKSYAAFMGRIQPQGDLLYNRIAPIYTTVDGKPNYDALDSRLLKHIAAGNEVCVEVALVDGLVLARSVFHHSVNYRSVVVLGHAVPVTSPAEKMAALELHMPEKEIMQQVREGVDKPRPKVLFEVGEMVRVKEGPFADFHGAVEDVNYEKNRLRVAVTIFGRSTPVELEFAQVEKA